VVELRHSPDGRTVAAINSRGEIRVHDLGCDTATTLTCSKHDSGGTRMLPGNGGSLLMIAAYHEHGVRCLEADGNERWVRRDLKKTQQLAWAFGRSVVYCVIEARGCFHLDTTDGRGCGHWRGVRDVVSAPEAPLAVRCGRALELVRGKEELLGRAKPLTFAVLGGAFTSDFVAISEAGGPVRFFDLNTFSDLGRFIPPRGSHVLNPTAVALTGGVRGVLFDYEKTGRTTVVDLTPNGSATELFVLPSTPAFAFCLSGTAILLADGRLLDAATGQTKSRLWDTNFSDA
jgi:hypothetical protein